MKTHGTLVIMILGWLMWLGLTASTLLAAATAQQDGLDLPATIRDSLNQKLNDSGKYTPDQLLHVRECLEKTGFTAVINCLSGGGMEDMDEVLVLLKDELSDLKEVLCGDPSGREDYCARMGENLKQISNDLRETLTEATARGKASLEMNRQHNEMKRNICKKINDDGCWRWLHERLEIKCSRSVVGTIQTEVMKCRMAETKKIWTRLNE